MIFAISAPTRTLAAPLPSFRLPGVRVAAGAIAPGVWVRYSFYSPKRGAALVRLAALGRVDKAQWFEVSFSKRRGRVLVIRMLIEGALGKPSRVRETIVQPPGQIPLSLPAKLAQKQAPKLDAQKPGRLVGHETITVPAGRFVVEHFRGRKRGHVEDAWLTKAIPGWSLVRYRSGKKRIDLVAWGKDARSEIVGTPLKLDPRLLPKR